MADIEITLKALWDNSGVSQGKQDIANLASSMSSHFGIAENSSKELVDAVNKLGLSLDKMSDKLDKAGRSGRKYGKGFGDVTPEVEKLNKGIGSANSTAIEFSRIVQDAPYGLQGMANNITQLSQSFANTTRQAGGASAALSAVWKSAITGPNLLVLGISLATSALVYFGNRARKTKKEVDDVTSSFDKYLKTLQGVAAESLRGEADAQKEIVRLNTLRRAVEDTNSSMNDRLEAMKVIKAEYPAQFANLTTEQILTGDVSGAYDNLTKSLIASAKARAYENKIAENSIKSLKLESESLAKFNELQKTNAEIERLRRIESDPSNRIGVSGRTGDGLSRAAESARDALIKDIGNLGKELLDINKENLRLETEIDNVRKDGLDFLKQSNKEKGKGNDGLKNDRAEYEGLIGSLRRLNEEREKAQSELELAVGTEQLTKAQEKLTELDMAIFRMTSKIHTIQMKVVAGKIGIPDLPDVQSELNQAINLSTNPWDKKSDEQKYYDKLVKDRYKNEAKQASEWLKQKAELEKKYDKEVARARRDTNRMIERGLERAVGDIMGTLGGINQLEDKSFGSVFAEISGGLTGMFDDLFQRVIADKMKKVFVDNIEESGEKLNDSINKGANKMLTIAAGLSAAGGLISGLTNKTSTLGQATGGALSGAGAGLAVGGPIGAAIGGLVGAIGGIFSAKKARKEEKQRQQLLEEQKKQTALMERQNAMSFLSQIVGRMVEGVGVINNVDIGWDGQLVTKVSGDDLEFILQRTAKKKKTQ